MLEGEALDRFVDAYWGDRLKNHKAQIDDAALLENGAADGVTLGADGANSGSGYEKTARADGISPEESDVLEDYQMPLDGMIIRPVLHGKVEKRTWVSLGLFMLLLPPLLYFSVAIFHGQKYLLCSLIIVVFSMVPFFMIFEGRKPQPREMMVIAVLAGIGVAGRAAFFMVPNFKPIAAVVILTGISFGGEAGFLVGCLIILVSNMFMGQGPWTPWQMFSYGLIGLLAGVLFQKGILKPKKLHLCIYGFLSVIFIFGGIMNPAAVLMTYGYLTKESLIAYYISGIPVDTVHASSTVIFLWFMSRPLLEKLERIKKKYGLCESRG